jgi:hypothetical protein
VQELRLASHRRATGKRLLGLSWAWTPEILLLEASALGARPYLRRDRPGAHHRCLHRLDVSGPGAHQRDTEGGAGDVRLLTTGNNRADGRRA